MPAVREQKLAKLNRLTQADNPIAVFRQLETLRDQNQSLEDALVEARKSFQKHVETMDSILSQLEEKKLNVSEFQAFGGEVKQALKNIQLIPGPKGERGEKGDKPIPGVDFPMPRDGRDGRDGAKGERGESIIGPMGLAGKDGSPDTPAEIKIKLESLKGEDRLDASAIKNLPTQRFGGGGFSKIAMDGHIIDDEAPAGTKNGVNKVFTLTNIPNPSSSLKVYRGGARQRLTEDYTVSNGTITFTVAPASGEIILADYRV